MPAFLSPEWLEQAVDGQQQAHGAGALVIDQIVTGSPFGDVAYRVVIDEGRAWMERAQPGREPDLAITVSYETAAAVAQGRLSTQRALMEGRMRIRGNPKPLAGRSADLAGLDPIPAELRHNTTY
jgi:hypothetical protein